MSSAPPPGDAWLDTVRSYGWVSILLHWTAAVGIIVLWFLGDTIVVEDAGHVRRIHTTLALTLYVVLWARVVWRIRSGHPGRLPRQGPITFAMGKWTHYLMIAALTVVLVSGPIQAWTAGQPVWFYGLAIPAATAPAVFALFKHLHGWAADILMGAATLHMLAVMWHIAVDRDGAFDRIMTPSGGRDVAGPAERG